ncbi:MAG: type II toxin-antitoxin system RelE/ParE family toxin [Verrucomicrobiota bacterium]|jgi:mRNA interferase RelE/StbE
MRYCVILPKSVQKKLDRLPDDTANRVLARLAALETNPRPPDVKKLKGREGWRIRIGDYRVIYEIYDSTAQVIVITVGHRREVYQ